MKQNMAGALALVLLSACARSAPAPLSGEALVARGDYLVNGVVLCGDCHTPLTGDPAEGGTQDLTRRLQGAPFAAEPPLASYAPAIAGGPANYTQDQFIAFLQTGVRPDGSRARPPMPQYGLNLEDARAVDAYVRSLPAAEPAHP